MIRINQANPIKRLRMTLLPLVAAMGLALLAVATATGRAHAGQATLTASENPVTIAFGQTTKTINLNWSLNGAAPVGQPMLAVYEANTLLSLTPLATETGSMPLTVTAGKVYATHLVTTTGVLASLTITTKSQVIPAPEFPMAPQAKVQPHGTYAGFDITVAKSSTFKIEASTSQPNANGTFGWVAASATVPNPTTHALVNLLGLQPNTTYYYVVTATDGQGNTTKMQGSFKTLKRNVTVVFDNLDLIDDSDSAGDCECRFEFRVNGQPVQDYVNNDFGTNDPAVNPNVKFVFTTTMATLSMSVRGFDDDESCIFGLCVCGLGGIPAGTGENDCGEWSTAAATRSFKTGPGEMYTETFQLATFGGNGSSLKFTAAGSFVVTYAP